MRVTVCAVGRLRSGPERDLWEDYLFRFERVGRGVGLGPARLIEVEDRKGGGMRAEAALLERACPDGAVRLAMDERGAAVESPGLARMLAEWRDAGRGDLAVLIGGADGLDPDLRDRADAAIALGLMVWPHMLVRVMIAEQLYRAAAILAGTPYHRG